MKRSSASSESASGYSADLSKGEKSLRSLLFSRLAATFLLLLITVLGAVYLIATKLVADFAVSDNRNSLTLLAGNIRAHYLKELSSLDRLAERPPFSPYKKAAAAELMETFLRIDNPFTTLHAYSADGRLLEVQRRSGIKEYRAEENFRDRKNKDDFTQLAEQVLNTGKPIAGASRYTSSGHLFQLYLAPFFEEGGTKVAGFLSGGVFPRLHRIDYLLEGLQLAEGNFIVIADDKGNILARSGLKDSVEAVLTREIQIASAAPRAFDPRPDIKKGAHAPLELRLDAGHDSDYLVLGQAIPELRSWVALGVDLAQVRGKREVMVRYVSFAMALGLLLSFFFAARIGGTLSSPLEKLRTALQQLANGNFSYRIGATQTDELHALCRLVDGLAQKMEKDRTLGDLWTEPEAKELLPPSS